ncbi:acetoacetyl-CoA synthetase [Photobacterium aquae]|uniref:Acetoacetyl-CoA synthetase n=2 Tax=Photobacterium aquae TaxID=1195763 RepID=A0A0J1H0U7_9GAMM|nr:acetoacetyl-CoA synthetase [Photobacterium aquae]
MWMPDRARVENSLLYQFMATISKKQNTVFHDYNQLHQWSIENSETFWAMLWDFCKIQGDYSPPASFCPPQSLTPAKDTQWFPHCRLNYAENLLAHWREQAAADAIIFHSEGAHDHRRHLSWQQLYRQTSQLVQYLKNKGIRQGDVVAGYLPNIPETVIAMLATSAIGAIWTSTSPDFGSDSVIERFGQTRPKLLFYADGYIYNNKRHHYDDKVSAICKQLPSLQDTVRITYIGSGNNDTPPDKPRQSPYQHTTWQQILADHPPSTIVFEPVPFNHPLSILYSSGTTGKPKCIVHSVGGTLLNHLKEHKLHCDVKAGDTVFYFTTCGWMMWNWLVSALASGATIVLYDGSPFSPSANILWDIAENENITLFGTSAKYLETLEKRSFRPIDTYSLPHLRTLCSTGSVLSPEQFDYVYQSIRHDIQLASISGGTDICGCFAIGNPISPVYRGECQGRALAMDVQVYDSDGIQLQEQQGELVCTNSFPNQPVGFLGDNDGSRYHKAYWSEYPGVWHHGDYVALSPTGGMTFSGRSDTVLNPGGIRLGTAEIYRQVNPLEAIQDSLVIGQKTDNDIRVVLFVQLADGYTLTDQLKLQIQERIRTGCSPRHTPEIILEVPDIPRTKSGKLVELAVKNIVHNQPVNNLGAIANPHALEAFKNRPELLTTRTE